MGRAFTQGVEDCHVSVEELRIHGTPTGTKWSARFGRGTRSRTRLPEGWTARVAAERLGGLAHGIGGRVLVDDQDLGRLDLEELARWRAVVVCLCAITTLEPDRPPSCLLAAATRPGVDRRERVTNALGAWGLSAAASTPVRNLRLRGRRRLVMARASLQRPEIVLVPEPGWGSLVRRLLRLLAETGEPTPTTIVLQDGPPRPRGRITKCVLDRNGWLRPRDAVPAPTSSILAPASPPPRQLRSPEWIRRRRRWMSGRVLSAAGLGLLVAWLEVVRLRGAPWPLVGLGMAAILVHFAARGVVLARGPRLRAMFATGPRGPRSIARRQALGAAVAAALASGAGELSAAAWAGVTPDARIISLATGLGFVGARSAFRATPQALAGG